MITVYYPNRARLDFIGDDEMPQGGLMGKSAHIKANSLIRSGKILIINYEPFLRNAQDVCEKKTYSFPTSIVNFYKKHIQRAIRNLKS